MERALTGWLRADPSRTEDQVGEVVLADLPPGPPTEALLRRRETLGLPTDDAAPVLVAPDGSRPPPEAVAATLRRARSVRSPIHGDADFCRGLLATRDPAAEAAQVPPRD